jgi:hypothetical protein
VYCKSPSARPSFGKRRLEGEVELTAATRQPCGRLQRCKDVFVTDSGEDDVSDGDGDVDDTTVNNSVGVKRFRSRSTSHDCLRRERRSAQPGKRPNDLWVTPGHRIASVAARGLGDGHGQEGLHEVGCRRRQDRRSLRACARRSLNLFMA